MFNKKTEITFTKKIKSTYVCIAPETDFVSYIFSKYVEDDVFFVVSGEKKWHFDNYKGQPAIVFFLCNSDCKARDIYLYMLGSKNIELPARYKDLVPNYSEIFIVNFLSIDELPFTENFSSFNEYKAFCSKIDEFIYIDSNGKIESSKK